MNIQMDDRDIYIYGAGTVADLFWIYLQQHGLDNKVRGFVVSRKAGNPNYKHSFKVLEFAECYEMLCEVRVVVATQKQIQSEICHLLHSHNINNVICVEPDMLLDEVYSGLYIAPIQNNKILFSNMKGQGYGGNPKYIADKLLELDIEKRLELVWVVEKGKNYNLPQGIRQVEVGTEEYYYEHATSKVWIDNMRKDFDIKKRDGQYYIQAWHGAAPIKKVEKDVLHSLTSEYIENAKKDSAMADCFLSGSVFYTDLYKRSFWYKGDIMEVGLPRHDIFWHTEGIRKKVCDYYRMSENQGLVLYAPTFRKSYNMDAYDLDVGKVLQALQSKFGKAYTMLVSKHPNNRYKEYSCIDMDKCIDVAGYEDFQELLVAADVLITDYSGCMYDYSFTQKPIFLYQRDQGEYLEERNFYVNIHELPYPKATTNQELMDLIAQFDETAYRGNVSRFMNRMGNFDTGNASEKVAKHIMGVMKIKTERDEC